MPVSYVPYALCLALVVAYAHERFETPADLRWTTRPGRYWWGYAGYVTCAVFAFLALCFVLALDAVRQALLDPSLAKEVTKLNPDALKAVMSLPVPFAAALAVSVLIPRLPVLQRWDQKLLAWIREKANIPGEVQELARRLQPQQLALTPDSVAWLRGFVEAEDRLPNSLTGHLRDTGGEGYEQSQYRFTRVLHLYAHLKRLSGLARYAKFFRDQEKQLDAAERDFLAFTARSDALLTLAREVHKYEAEPEFAKVLAERRAVYREECAAALKPLASLAAHALLRSEATDAGVEARLREIGFTSEVPDRPLFPLNEITLLAVALSVLFLLVGGPLAPHLFPHMPAGAPRLDPEAVGVFIVLAHLLATLITVRAVQRLAAFRARPGQAPPVFACVCLAGACAAASWMLCAAFAWLATGQLAAPFTWPVTALNGVLALALSLLCTGGLTRLLRGKWLQPAEAAATAAAMALAGWLTAWQLGLVAQMPPGELGRLALVTIVLPGIVGLLMGGFVPRLCRAAQAAAP